MLISLLSPRISSRSRAGFTLIELLISAAIITVITSIVLVRFNAFDGTVLLKSMAYEVATTVREAQIYSISVYNVLGGSTQTYRYPYGLHFVRDTDSYTLFRFDSADSDDVPAFGESDGVSEQTVRVIGLNGMRVNKICAVTNSGCTDISSIDISFRRPEFAAIFYTGDLSPSTLAEVSAVRVYFQSEQSAVNTWIVEVKLLGQINTYRCAADCEP